MKIIRKTIESICTTVARDLGACSMKSTGENGKSIERQVASMPDYLYPMLCILIIVFNIYTLLLSGSYFYNLDYESRSLFLKKMRISKFSPFNDFIRLFDSLTLLRIRRDE